MMDRRTLLKALLATPALTKLELDAIAAVEAAEPDPEPDPLHLRHGGYIHFRNDDVHLAAMPVPDPRAGDFMHLVDQGAGRTRWYMYDASHQWVPISD